MQLSEAKIPSGNHTVGFFALIVTLGFGKDPPKQTAADVVASTPGISVPTGVFVGAIVPVELGLAVAVSVPPGVTVGVYVAVPATIGVSVAVRVPVGVVVGVSV